MNTKSLLICGVVFLSGCVAQEQEVVTTRSAPELTMRWDHLSEGPSWTTATMSALDSHGTVLADLVPADIEEWCPDYPNQSRTGRNAFWTGMLSALAKHESTWRPDAVGGGGKWYGLVQILPGTARGYGCEARSGGALKNGVANLNCAVRIIAQTVPRDGVVSRGMRGIAADWGPFHSARKREDMRAWVQAQPYCRAPS
ncbi:transglycosylase SLT domain-containing protein [Aliiroseovarius sp. KMU-50]|uniref:Transglycosylase SLT domain-containing protein n=1 Tax=Aliiroseovarius salicola TaxID=3009082 RepID=A0ABT4W3R9_9RHOB|nr:transglycosylase SLT domain-containing protein [Aliiroseovarius sp. KMU-50]MDA5094442.1 transglycosylase SLT domain-containing protein [Aliiroseovarius sp. KMU-50]